MDRLLTRVTIPTDRIREALWKQLLLERDACAKQKEHVDGKRSAEYSDSVERDQILLNKIRENKLWPNFEPAQYKVSQKKGNVVI